MSFSLEIDHFWVNLEYNFEIDFEIYGIKAQNVLLVKRT